MTNLYKCIYCGSIGHDIIYDVYMTEQCEKFIDSRTGKVIRTISGPPDEYDLEYPVWTKCAICKADLIGSSKEYIIEADIDETKNV